MTSQLTIDKSQEEVQNLTRGASYMTNQNDPKPEKEPVSTKKLINNVTVKKNVKNGGNASSIFHSISLKRTQVRH